MPLFMDVHEPCPRGCNSLIRRRAGGSLRSCRAAAGATSIRYVKWC
jgi:hypothetical protein